MRYFPAFFDIKDRTVFVTGGGEIALRKVRLLLKAGPKVVVFDDAGAPAIAQELGDGVTIVPRALTAADFETDRPALVIAGADEEEADAETARLARAAKVPVNVVDQPGACDFVVPSLVERGDLTIGISTGGAAPIIGRRLRERIEAMLPHRLGDLIEFARVRRDVVASRVPGRARRGFWERLFSSPLPEAIYQGDEARAERLFDEAVASADKAPRGAIHIVGAGPGDPELLTLKALRVLQEADVVLYDNLVSDDILELVRRDAERHYVGKRKADHSMAQEDIGTLMISLAGSGKRVVRLKGGDPYIFGRGGEELDQIKAAGLTATVVPGITAAQGCAAASDIPLTHRGVSQAVTYVTAHAGKGGAPDVDWEALARLKHTVVVYMGVGRARQVAFDLIRGGLPGDTPAAIIEKGSCPDQRTIRTRLADLGAAVEAGGITGPAVLVIGAVAAKADGATLQTFLRQEVLAA